MSEFYVKYFCKKCYGNDIFYSCWELFVEKLGLGTEAVGENQFSTIIKVLLMDISTVFAGFPSVKYSNCIK